MITPNEQAVWDKLRTGDADINDQQLFFSILYKGLLHQLNQDIKIRGLVVPHIIINTGDDIMYLEAKGQNAALEPLEITNENYVYNTIPRCIVTFGSVAILTDQLTSPYTRGVFNYEADDMIYSFNAEYRRLPLQTTAKLKYYVDSFTDSLQLMQQIMTKLVFIRSFDVTYLGQSIRCSYRIPDTYEPELMLEFDGVTTDSKLRTLEVDLTVETNLPVVYNETIIPGDGVIKHIKNTITAFPDTITHIDKQRIDDEVS